MTTNEERIRDLEDENERLRSQLEDWKEKAPPPVKLTMELNRSEQIAVYVARVIAEVQGEMAKKANERALAASKRYLKAIERGNELLAKTGAALEAALEAVMDVDNEHSPAHELHRIRKAVETLTGQSHAD